MSSAAARKAAALAALDLAEELNGGKVSVANIEAEMIDAARSLFGSVVGPDDPLWSLQIDVARQVIHQGGIGLDELREWVAVLERRAGGAVQPSETPEPPGPPVLPADP